MNHRGPRQTDDPVAGSSLRVESAFMRRTTHAHWCNRIFGAAADHHVRRAALDNLERIACAEAEQAVAVAEFGPFAP